MTGDACEEFAFGRRAVDAEVLAPSIRRRVDRLPCRLPQGINNAAGVKNQFADVTTTFKNCDVAPSAVEPESRRAIQYVRMANER
jgi:hypothetical protein